MSLFTFARLQPRISSRTLQLSCRSIASASVTFSDSEITGPITGLSPALAKPVPPRRSGHTINVHLEKPHNTMFLEAENISTPTEFLKAIGRGADTKVEPPKLWHAFWSTVDGEKLRADGLGVKDRRFALLFVRPIWETYIRVVIRYILWCMEKFRQGYSVQDFPHEPKPPKKVRGYVLLILY